MNVRISLSAIAAGISLLIGNLSADEAVNQDQQVKKAQTVCPVMGGNINKSLFVDYQGKRIYVCCSGCVGTVKADPAKYINQLEAKGVVLDEASKAVVSGKTTKNEKKGASCH